jgi:hypothetical protein
MNTTNHTSPSGEDAANGAMGEREAFEAWWDADGRFGFERTGKDSARSLWDEFLRVTGRAALTAEKVAAQVVDSAIVDCDIDMARAVRAATHEVSLDPYMGAPQPAQTQVALTDEHIRKIAEEHFWGGKCTTADDLEKAIVAALREASLAAQPVSGVDHD